MDGNCEQQAMDQQPTIEEPQNGVEQTTEPENSEMNEVNEVNEMNEEIEEGSLIKAGCDDEGKIFVGGLSWNTDTKGLKAYFAKFGEVKDCTIKEDSNSKRSRGFGFVLFADPESVKRVLEQSTHTLDNRTIDPKKAKALKKEHKIFAGGFSPDLTNDQLKAHFSAFGEIELLERPTEKPSEKPKGFCFITYKNGQAVEDACKIRYQEIEGKRCEVKKAEAQRDRGRGRAQAGFGYGQNYYQGNWNPPSWQGYGGGYGDYGPGTYGNFGNFNYNQSGGFGPSQTGYGNYYSGYGYGSYSGAGSFQGGYGPGQQQTQPHPGFGKTARRGGQNTYKPY